MTTSTAIVTGAAGFIGSHLVDALLASGAGVVGVDALRRPGDAEANLAGARRDGRFTLVDHDLRAPLDAGVVPSGATLFHLAALPGARGTDVAAYERENVRATEHVVALAQATGARRIVLASSSSVYGRGRRWASREDDAPAPLSPYARTKAESERLVLGSGLDAVVLRYFSVYGSRQRPDMAFSQFIAAATAGRAAPLFQGASAERDFTFVGDVVAATLAAADRGRPGRIYNVGAGRPVSVGDALELLAGLLGRRVPLAPMRSPVAEPDRTWCDASRALAELGWQATTELVDGLRAQVGDLAVAVA